MRQVRKVQSDYYSYNITVEDGAKKHSVKCSDIAMTKELRQLISSFIKGKEINFLIAFPYNGSVRNVDCIYSILYSTKMNTLT